MREIKSINGLRVISASEGASLGTVSQVVVDLATGAVVGLIIGNGAAERGLVAADIQTIGTDVVMVASAEVARPLADFPEIEQRKASSVHLVPVFTSAGRRLGVVSSIFIDPLEKVVTHYEVSSGAIKDLADGLLVMPIIPGAVHGQDAVIVPDEGVRAGGRETGGLFARFSQWGDSARKQYQQVAESAEKMVETGSEALKKEAAVVREKAKEVGEKAKVAGEKAAEKAKEVGEKAVDKAKEATEKAKEAGEHAVDKAKDVGEMIGEKATEVGAKAKDAVTHLGDEDSDEAKPAEEASAEPCSADKPECASTEDCDEGCKPARDCGCGCDSQES